MARRERNVGASTVKRKLCSSEKKPTREDQNGDGVDQEKHQSNQLLVFQISLHIRRMKILRSYCREVDFAVRAAKSENEDVNKETTSFY